MPSVRRSDVRTFAQLLAHIAEAQYIGCAAVLGEAYAPRNLEQTASAKAQVIPALRSAFAYCGSRVVRTPATLAAAERGGSLRPRSEPSLARSARGRRTSSSITATCRDLPADAGHRAARQPPSDTRRGRADAFAMFAMIADGFDAAGPQALRRPPLPTRRRHKLVLGQLAPFPDLQVLRCGPGRSRCAPASPGSTHRAVDVFDCCPGGGSVQGKGTRAGSGAGLRIPQAFDGCD